MKISITLILLSVCHFFASGQSDSTRVSLKGNLKNFSNGQRLEDFSEFSELCFPDRHLEITKNSNGDFSLSFSLAKANYFKLGRNTLYLQPGDNLEMQIDFNDPTLAEFSGSGRDANLYLSGIPFPKAGSFIDGGLNIKKDINKTIDTILILASARRTLLKNTTKLTDEFRVLENARITADLINSFKYLPGIFILWNKMDDPGHHILKTYNQMIEPYINRYSKNFLDTTFLKLLPYRNNLSTILEIGDSSSMVYKKIEDFLTAKVIFSKLSKNKNNKTKIDSIGALIHKVNNLLYKEKLQEAYNTVIGFGNGDKAIDFATYCSDDKKGRLSDMKGKIIFIDLWATWCVPCLEEMPYFEKLKKRYKNRSDVLFVSLCVNDTMGKWKSNLIKRKATGIQLFAKAEDIIDYRVTFIPRTIIINKDFEIENISGPLPSSDEVDKILNRLISK